MSADNLLMLAALGAAAYVLTRKPMTAAAAATDTAPKPAASGNVGDYLTRASSLLQYGTSDGLALTVPRIGNADWINRDGQPAVKNRADVLTRPLS